MDIAMLKDYLRSKIRMQKQPRGYRYVLEVFDDCIELSHGNIMDMTDDLIFDLLTLIRNHNYSQMPNNYWRVELGQHSAFYLKIVKPKS